MWPLLLSTNVTRACDFTGFEIPPCSYLFVGFAFISPRIISHLEPWSRQLTKILGGKTWTKSGWGLRFLGLKSGFCSRRSVTEWPRSRRRWNKLRKLRRKRGAPNPKSTTDASTCELSRVHLWPLLKRQPRRHCKKTPSNSYFNSPKSRRTGSWGHKFWRSWFEFCSIGACSKVSEKPTKK